jgi:hypothetical protein
MIRNLIIKTVARLALPALLAIASATAQALPVLRFSGAVGYDYNVAGDDLLGVDAVLTGFEDIIPVPELSGSLLTLDALFVSSINSAAITTGYFTGVTGYDIQIFEGDGSGGVGSLLLSGDFNGQLVMTGRDGRNRGTVTAMFTPTAGSLLVSSPGVWNLLALEINLTTTFGATMFGGDFSGDILGEVKAVPEPSTAMLLGIALLTGSFGMSRRRRRR